MLTKPIPTPCCLLELLFSMRITSLQMADTRHMKGAGGIPGGWPLRHFPGGFLDFFSVPDGSCCVQTKNPRFRDTLRT